jgi:hypothetical protein
MRPIITKPPYFVIKCDAGYWLEEGGCTDKQCEAERYETREIAQADLMKWCDRFERSARVVKIVRKK